MRYEAQGQIIRNHSALALRPNDQDHLTNRRSRLKFLKPGPMSHKMRSLAGQRLRAHRTSLRVVNRVMVQLYCLQQQFTSNGLPPTVQNTCEVVCRFPPQLYPSEDGRSLCGGDWYCAQLIPHRANPSAANLQPSLTRAPSVKSSLGDT